jgi:hypothetical protein
MKNDDGGDTNASFVGYGAAIRLREVHGPVHCAEIASRALNGCGNVLQSADSASLATVLEIDFWWFAMLHRLGIIGSGYGSELEGEGA